MGDELRRKLLLNHLDKANKILGEYHETNSDEEDEDYIGSLPSLTGKSSSPKTRYPLIRSHIKRATSNEGKPEVIANWNDFYQDNETFELKERNYSFNTYFNLPKIDDTDTPIKSIPFFIFHHGAGSSALTFASLSNNLQQKLDNQCGSFSFDARNHGQTKQIDTTIPRNYKKDEFCQDFIQLFTLFFEKYLANNKNLSKFSFILVGHSFGGSVCTASFNKFPQNIKKLILGVVMFDIVEEAAIFALEKVDHFLQNTPNIFKSNTEAINWHIEHGLCSSKESAEISVPALFKPLKDSNNKIVRITNLKSFQPFWNDWFINLSKDFVILPTSKLLILAGNDNLDKDLIVGQMQGKYQLVVFQDSGHFIQEDATNKTALTLIEFWRRNDTKNVVIKSNWGSAK